MRQGLLFQRRPIAMCFLALLGGCATASPRIELTHGPVPETTLRVSGLTGAQRLALETLAPEDPAWNRLFHLKLESGSAADAPLPFMLGSSRLSGSSLWFEPEFPLQRGRTYRATFDPGALNLPGAAAPLHLTFTIAESARPAPQITAVHPSSDRLPENLLKFYIHFSTPMQQGDLYRHIHLLDDQGRVVELPFLELPEALWNPDGTRLTVLFDPGRVKRGLKPNEESGAVLIAGRSYTLVISADWPDAAGRPLGRDHRKTFHTLPADRIQPDPARWKLVPPASGDRKPLSVHLDEPLDRAMLEHALRVLDPANQPVAGTIHVTDDAKLWRFMPNLPWRPGTHHLEIDPRLEDLAGNSLGRPFERDLARSGEPGSARPALRPFDVQ